MSDKHTPITASDAGQAAWLADQLRKQPSTTQHTVTAEALIFLLDHIVARFDAERERDAQRLLAEMWRSAVDTCHGA